MQGANTSAFYNDDLVHSQHLPLTEVLVSKRLTFRDRFDTLMEIRLSGVAGLRYIMVYGKSQIN